MNGQFAFKWLISIALFFCATVCCARVFALGRLSKIIETAVEWVIFFTIVFGGLIFSFNLFAIRSWLATVLWLQAFGMTLYLYRKISFRSPRRFSAALALSIVAFFGMTAYLHHGSFL